MQQVSRALYSLERRSLQASAPVSGLGGTLRLSTIFCGGILFINPMLLGRELNGGILERLSEKRDGLDSAVVGRCPPLHGADMRNSVLKSVGNLLILTRRYPARQVMKSIICNIIAV